VWWLYGFIVTGLTRLGGVRKGHPLMIEYFSAGLEYLINLGMALTPPFVMETWQSIGIQLAATITGRKGDVLGLG